MRSQDEEVDVNYDAFIVLLHELLPTRRGKYALLRHGEIVDFFDTAAFALAAGRDRFTDGFYSIQEVTDRPVDLGFFSHAVHPRLA
jgi:hypothetical protein